MRIAFTIPRRLLCGLLPALFVVLLLATTARAEEPSALERLTTEERVYLEAQVPDWDELSAQRRERIARSVIRIRELPEEKRRALLDRIQRLKHGREAGRGPRPGRLEHHLDPRRVKSHRRRTHVMKAVGAVLWSGLPEDTRRAIDRTYAGHDRERVRMAFFRRLVGRIAKRRAEEGVPAIPVSADLSPEWRRGLEKLRAEAEAGDAGALRKLAHISVFHDLRSAGAELERNGPPDEAAVRRLGARVKEQYPEAFAATIAELAEAAQDETALRRYAPPPPPHRGSWGRHGGTPQEQARRLLQALGHSGGLIRRHPELRESVQQLKRMLQKIAGDRSPPDRTGPGPGPGRRPGFPPGRRGPHGERGPRRAPPPPDDDTAPEPDDG